MYRLATETGVRLSIIIAASNDLPSLERCLESLDRQIGAEDIEIIVVSNYNGGVQSVIGKGFPGVRYIGLPPEATVPELRTRGVNCAKGGIIALLEDHCFADEDWSNEIIRAHELTYPAVGGSVENAGNSNLLDWAVYFYDYGKYMPPNQAGNADSLPGVNVTYKRSALDKVQESFRAGFFEAFVNEELKKQGEALYLAPSAIVYHRKSYEMKKMLTQFYHHARSFAGRRAAGFSLLRRLAITAGSPALSIILTARIALRTLGKHRRRKELWLSLPCIFILMASWSLGEFCGYLLGEGESAKHWR